MVYRPERTSNPSAPFGIQDLIASLAPRYQGSLGVPSSQPQQDINPFAALFGGGDLGGGSTSPDLATLAPPNNSNPYPDPRREAIERMRESKLRPMDEGPISGPVQQEMAPAYDDGNLAAINALMEMAGNVPQPGAGGGIDIAAIMKEAAGAARAPYQAEIQSTKHQNQRAKADTGESSNALRKMYAALSRSNKNAAVRESDQSMAAAEQIQGMGQQSADQLSADNAARLNQTAASSAALGSGDLNNVLATEVNANTAEGSRQLVEQAGLGATATANRGEAERRYLNRQGQNLKLTGTNRRADLYGDLQDYLQGNRDKISGLRGEATAAAGAAKTSASSAAASAQSDMYEQQYGAQQDMLQNQMALLGMKTDLQQQDFDNNMSTEDLGLRMQQFALDSQPKQEEQLIPGFDNRMVEALPDNERSALMMQQFLSPESGASLSKIMQNPALSSGFFESNGQQLPIGGNTINSQQLLKQLGLSGGDPRQNYMLAQIIAQLSNGNTDLPYGAQRQ